MQKIDYEQIEVRTQTSYKIVVGFGIWRFVNNYAKNRRRLIITDSNVYGFYKDIMHDIADKEDLFVFEAGEESKNYKTLHTVYDFLIKRKADRYTHIIAVGGGVVGDLAAFAASTYMRGVHLIHMPTSLLAMVDSSIGGKTAINYGGFKNIIGSFYQPEVVISDISFLNTLPEREFLSAVSEIVKYGIIQDEVFFNFLVEKREDLKKRVPSVLKQVVTKSTENKVKIVENDEKEKGRRALLNFGHTLAHAIESATGYSRYLHGEAVSIGEVFAALLSVRRNLTTYDTLNSIRTLLEFFSLPIVLDKTLSKDELFKIMMQDKKNKEGILRFVLTKGIGESIITGDLHKSEIMDSIDALKG